VIESSSDPPLSHDPELHRTCPENLNPAKGITEIKKLLVLRR
jgi:hypothetical protein